MPTATLIKPNSLSFLGRMWMRDVPVPVDFDMARALISNPRFSVSGLIGKDAVTEEALQKKPKDPTLMNAAIRAAVDELDVEDESNFTASGKPNYRALSEVLGYPVSAVEVANATGREATPQEKKAATNADLSKQVVEKRNANLVIKRDPSKKDALLKKLDAKQKMGLEPLDTGAGVTRAHDQDDSTDGAVEMDD